MELDYNLYQLGQWRVDCESQCISRDGHTVRLPSKVFQVLCILIREQGMTVSKYDLIDEVWDNAEETGAKGVTNAVWQLRQAFSTDIESAPEIIKTVPKLGYQLAIDAEPIIEAEGSAATKHNQKNVTLAPQSSDGEVVSSEREADNNVGEENKHRQKVKRDLLRRHRFSLIIFSIFALLFVYAKVMSAFQPVQNEKPDEPLGVYGEPELKITKQLTDYAGVERMPDVSPDGSTMVFQWLKSGERGRLYTKDLNTKLAPETPLIARETAVESASFDESNPRFSPSDTLVAYTRIFSDSQCEIWLYNFANAKDELLVDDCFALTAQRRTPFTWSPDGTSIVYSKKAHHGVALFRVTLDDGVKTQLTMPTGEKSDLIPLISDKGNLYFVRKAKMRSDVFLLEKGANKARKLSGFSAPIYSLAWDTKQQFLLVTVLYDGKLQLRTLTDNGLSHVIDFDHIPDRFSYSANRQAYVYTHYIAREYLAKFDLASGQAATEVQSNRRDMYGQYAQDGRFIFNSNRTGHWEVWLRDNGQEKQLTKELGMVALAAISPDGEQFAVPIKAIGEQDFTMYLGTTLGDSLKRVSLPNQNVRSFSWSPDGEYIYFTSDDSGVWNLYRLAIASKGVEQITVNGGFYGVEFAGRLLFSRYQQKGLWQLDLQTGEQSLLTDKLSAHDWGNFVVAEEGIYFVANDEGFDDIKQIDANGEIRQLQRLPMHTIKSNRSISFAPEQQLLMTLRGVEHADIFEGQLKFNSLN